MSFRKKSQNKIKEKYGTNQLSVFCRKEGKIIHEKKAYLPAGDIAREFNYSLSHASLLAREKKVDAVWTGKRWYINRSSVLRHRKTATKVRSDFKSPKTVLSPSSLTPSRKEYISERADHIKPIRFYGFKTATLILIVSGLFLFALQYANLIEFKTDELKGKYRSLTHNLGKTQALVLRSFNEGGLLHNTLGRKVLSVLDKIFGDEERTMLTIESLQDRISVLERRLKTGEARRGEGGIVRERIIEQGEIIITKEIISSPSGTILALLEQRLSNNEKTGKVEYQKVRALLDMGVQTTYELITEDGRQIRTTSTHPYLVKNSGSRPIRHKSSISNSAWLTVSNIKPGDYIAAPRSSALADSTGAAPNLSVPGLAMLDGDNKNNIRGAKNKLNSVISDSHPEPIRPSFQFYNPPMLKGVAKSFELGNSMKDRESGLFGNLENLLLGYGVNNYLEHENYYLARFADLITSSKGTQELSRSASLISRSVSLTDSGEESSIKSTKSSSIFLDKTEEGARTPRKFLSSMTVMGDVDLDINQNYNKTDKNVKKQDFLWTKIKSIEKVGEEQVYDIEVEGTHNFVAGHYIDRRTGKALIKEQEEVIAAIKNLELGTWNSGSDSQRSKVKDLSSVSKADEELGTWNLELRNGTLNDYGQLAAKLREVAYLARSHGLSIGDLQNYFKVSEIGDIWFNQSVTESGNFSGVQHSGGQRQRKERIRALSYYLGNFNQRGSDSSDFGAKTLLSYRNGTSKTEKSLLDPNETNAETYLKSAQAILQVLSSKLQVSELNNIEFGGIVAHNTYISGNLGIGTTSPVTKFETQGTASANYLLTGNTLQVGGFASVAYNRFGTSTTGHSNYISTTNDVLVSGDLEVRGTSSFGGVASVSGNFFTYGTNTFSGTGSSSFAGSLSVAKGFLAGANNALVVNANATADTLNVVGGNVGIGTTAPIAAADIEPAVAFTGPLFRVASGSNERLRIQSDGNFGIGTTGTGRPAPEIAIALSEQGRNRHCILVPSGQSPKRDGPEGRELQQKGNVGIGTTVPAKLLDVDGEVQINFPTTGATTIGVCKSVADGTAADNNLVECSSTPGDIAEWYPSQSDVEAGDLVMLTDQTFTFSEEQFDPKTGLLLSEVASRSVSIVAKATKENRGKVVGVISTSPYQVLGEAVAKAIEGQKSSSTGASISAQGLAISGRVPLKVSGENGPINVGDPLTVSGVAGTAMKATSAGRIVGYALEPFNGSTSENMGKIMVFIGLGYYAGDIGAVSSAGSTLFADEEVSILKSVAGMFKEGLLKIQTLVAKLIQTEELEVDSQDKPTGITIYDEDTSRPHCFRLKSGATLVTPGKCGTGTIPDILVEEPISDITTGSEETPNQTEQSSDGTGQALTESAIQETASSSGEVLEPEPTPEPSPESTSELEATPLPTLEPTPETAPEPAPETEPISE